MNTKQAIYFLENKVEDVGMPTPVINERINDVIELLQRGEKYKQIFTAIQGEILSDEYEDIYGMPTRRGSIYKRYKIIEQKYFPKPSDNFTEKVMDKINKKGGR